MQELADISGYRYGDAERNASHAYLLPAIKKLLAEQVRQGKERRIFEIGCGNGSIANALSGDGFSIIGVDPSIEAVKHANLAYPSLQILQRSAYGDLAGEFGQFPFVISLEVVEHVYAPRKYANTVFSLLEDGGYAIISTPFHGYWKNLALAISGRMDAHFTALWDHGHIKFWSIETLGLLLSETGFRDIEFILVGRIPLLAKSMIAIARR